MRLLLVSDRGRTTLPLPARGTDSVLSAEHCDCGASPQRVLARRAERAADDRAYEAEAVAACCGRALGRLRLEPDTLWGITEDEAVLRHSRCSVYA